MGLYPHRRHPEGPVLATPLLFHQHLVDTVERGLPGTPVSRMAAVEEEAWEGPGVGGRPRGPG